MTETIVAPVLSINEAAFYLRASRGHVYNLFRRGDLTPLKVGGRTLVRRADLDALFERCAVSSLERPRPARTRNACHADMGIFG